MRTCKQLQAQLLHAAPKARPAVIRPPPGLLRGSLRWQRCKSTDFIRRHRPPSGRPASKLCNSGRLPRSRRGGHAAGAPRCSAPRPLSRECFKVGADSLTVSQPFCTRLRSLPELSPQEYAHAAPPTFWTLISHRVPLLSRAS
jgi:hypothetical protein